MGLHLMPYGPHPSDTKRISVGTLELLGQQAVIPRNSELGLADDKIASTPTWSPPDDVELEDAVSAVKDARIVIMNPPFTNRTKMGEKFPEETQKALRSRVDAMEQILVKADPSLMGVRRQEFHRAAFRGPCGPRTKAARWGGNDDQPYHRPIIHVGAEGTPDTRRAVPHSHRAHLPPTGQRKHEPADRHQREYRCHAPTHTDGPKSPTRFIHLDRMPADESETENLHSCLSECPQGQISNGWGEISHWPADRIAEGDWTPGIWRSPRLARSRRENRARSSILRPLASIPGCIAHDGSRRVRENFDRSDQSNEESIPILESKGAEGQKTIKSTPDGYWVFKEGRERQARHYLKWSSHLLVTAGQNNSTARLTATASESKYLGQTWFPVVGLSSDEAKAIAVFINSTPGRLQVMRDPGKTLVFPSYSPRATNNLRIPDINDDRIRRTLVDCWDRTSDMKVPQFRDGECHVRRLWDEAVAEAIDWDAQELKRLRLLLHNEPHVRGLGVNEYDDELEVEATTALERETFDKLADEWEQSRPRGADIEQMTKHPAYQRIIAMGEPTVPWLLQRLAENPDHWFVALNAITGARPVPPESRGRSQRNDTGMAKLGTSTRIRPWDQLVWIDEGFAPPGGRGLSGHQ